jgi:hypothetical protein
VKGSIYRKFSPIKWSEKCGWRCGCIQDVFHTGINRSNHPWEKFLRRTVYKIKGIMLPLWSGMRDWKPISENKIYVVLAHFMLIGIVQKPTLRSYLGKKKLHFCNSCIWLCNINGPIWINMLNLHASTTVTAKIHIWALQNFSKYMQWCPIWTGNFKLCTYQTRILQQISLWHYGKESFH